MRDVVVVVIRKQQDEGPALHSTREHPRRATPNGHVSPIFCMRPALVDAAPAKIPAACQRERKRKPNNARGSYRLVSTRPRQQSIVPAWADNSHKEKSMSIQKTQIGSCELICGTAASKAHNRPASAEPRPVRPLRQANVSPNITPPASAQPTLLVNVFTRCCVVIPAPARPPLTTAAPQCRAV